MSDRPDIEQDLLDAYYTALGTYQATTLSWMHFYCFPEEIDWQNFYGLLPVVAVWALDPTITPTCMDGPFRVEDITYRIRIASTRCLATIGYLSLMTVILNRRITAFRPFQAIR